MITARFAIACLFALGIVWGGVYLVINDHPWFGLLNFIIACTVKYRA